MLALHVVAAALVVIAAVGCLYHLALGIVSTFLLRTRQAGSDLATHSFAILIPAHNEELVLGRTLQSCAALDYPASQFKVFVVADNCSDATHNVAQAHGATSLVRTDDLLCGKGYALEWAIPKVLAVGHDVVLVVDADCCLESHALRALDQCLAAGDLVLQLHDAVSNPDESPTSFLLAVASELENVLFYAPKSALGLAVFLRGTGMAFHRSILEALPWRAHSVTEDAEYACALLRRGIPIRFVKDARVLSPFPTGYQQLAIQRRRWVGGGMALTRQQCLHLLWRGLTRREVRLIDAGLTTLLLSRPLIVLQLTVTIAVCGLSYWISGSPLSMGLFAGSLAILGAYAAYALSGLLLIGLTRRRMRLLLASSVTFVRYLTLALVSLVRGAPKVWETTPRAPLSSE